MLNLVCLETKYYNFVYTRMEDLPGHLIREIPLRSERDLYALAHTSKYFKELFKSELSAILLNKFVNAKHLDFAYFVPDDPLECLRFLSELFEDYNVNLRPIVLRFNRKYERASRQSRTVDALVPTF